MQKIEYKVGNLLDVESGVIVHGCNTKGVMGSGVALAIKEKYPIVYTKYRDHCADFINPSALLGDYILVPVKPDLAIANAFTQIGYGKGKRQVNYGAIADCFFDILYETDYRDFHIPKIGAGLAGGDWGVISEIIEYVTPRGTKVTCWTLE